MKIANKKDLIRTKSKLFNNNILSKVSAAYQDCLKENSAQNNCYAFIDYDNSHQTFFSTSLLTISKYPLFA